MGNRAGDNSQVKGLGEALGWPFEEKHFEFQSYEKFVNLPWGAHLMGIVKERSTPLCAPWPDLVISAGRKNEPIARYIQARAMAEEGNRTRLIHVGRPWAAPPRVYALGRGKNAHQNLGSKIEVILILFWPLN